MAKRRMAATLLTVLVSMLAWSQSEVYFTASTIEGVEVSYYSQSSEYPYICWVKGKEPFEGAMPEAAISTSTAGSVTIPESVSYNGNTYYVVYIGMNAFSGCDQVTAVTLPESIIQIGEVAFYGCRNMRSIVLPKKVSYNYFYSDDDTFFIGNGAFTNCTSLRDIVLPEGVKELQDNVFTYCTHLQSVTLPGTLKSIGYQAFQGCYNLATVTVKAAMPPTLDEAAFDDTSNMALYVPQGMKEDYQAAAGWSNFGSIVETAIDYQEGDTFVAKNSEGVAVTYKVLSVEQKTCQVGDGSSPAIDPNITGDVTIPASANGYSVTQVGDRAFQNCDASFVSLPDGIEVIGEYVFVNCRQMKRIVLPKGLTQIGQAIVSCYSLEYLYWPKSITGRTLPTVNDCPALSRIEMEDNPYGDCNAVVIGGAIELGCYNTTIPDGITGIGPWAFYGCTALKDVKLPASLKYIEDQAFYECSGLTSVVLPANVNRIGRSAFYGCSLTEVTVEAATPPTIYSNTFSNPASITLHVPAGSKDAYAAANYWKNFNEIIEPAKCATPTISFKDGRLHFECQTEGVEYHATVTTPASEELTGNDIALPLTYTVKVYATKQDYADSDVATANIDVRGLKGDLNEDGTVNSLDIQEVINIASEE